MLFMLPSNGLPVSILTWINKGLKLPVFISVMVNIDIPQAGIFDNFEEYKEILTTKSLLA